ncbi:NAD(P)-dependent alcohol dehydrogenase [Pseudomonas fluorescens]|uniref:NAD(P)-dependent alcohol dehydrogenase n=1 Tax=Pseudomonas TaxID=286 RepID=UPI0010C0312C|nr:MULTISPECIES: NAD(P)-dependent alcohol dehydrogenase [Pseudomonas]MBD8099269.1 NAD(P)-dependent alcohol dehydrogenase [Pseudomonas fluorescens]MBD8774188.1 NAD(P)-dependent alcohol dehydrogenase [Pseudomonas fluorescens]MBD8780782.1 NAD(P)-dependent alcohol dehydrogenase [Pseudomonas fluorescens]MBD8796659.1 NAD(P)-dependent alcohol dehydrogenase [Pseudomonas fluorescens]TKK32546.1 alcohol dehydrogenase [Pseudomonas sp. CFBP13528]
MKRIQYSRYGGPEVMQVQDFELPHPGEGEVGVSVKFSAINPIDWKLRTGQMKIVTGRKFPRAMGMDFSGRVISIGAGVTRFKVGDAVFGLARFKESGAFGHAVITKEAFLAHKPDDVPFEHAACLGTPGITAWNGLIDKAKLQAGQHVFVNGCAGAVGEAAVQIARMQGAVVSGSCSDRDMQQAKSLGMHTVYDYRNLHLSNIANRFDVVYDTAATLSISEGVATLKPGGVFLDLNPGPGKFVRAFFDRRLKMVIGSPRAEILDKLAKAASERHYNVRVAQTVSMAEAIRLITELEKGRKLGGKGVIAME